MIGDPVLAALLLGEEMSATGDLFRCQFQPVREIVTAFNRCQPVTETVGYLTVTLRSPNLATDRTLGADTLVSELAAYLARLFVTVGFVNHPLGDTRRQVPAEYTSTHSYLPELGYTDTKTPGSDAGGLVVTRHPAVAGASDRTPRWRHGWARSRQHDAARPRVWRTPDVSPGRI